MGEFLMPSLGADMDAGRIIEWRVKPGDTVHRGDIVAVVDTEKSDIEVEVFEDGVVEELLVDTGREVAVGTPLARITAAPAAKPAVAPAPAPPQAPEAKVVTSKPATTKPATGKPEAKTPRAKTPRAKTPAAKRAARVAAQAPVVSTSRTPAAQARVRSSPLARRRAGELGIDLSEVRGSGAGGAVVASDLVASDLVTSDLVTSDLVASDLVAGAPAAVTAPGAVPSPAVPAVPGERRSKQERQLAMRTAIADLMARSKREIPHYYLATTIDLAAATSWLAAENARRSVTDRLLPAALLLKATALAAVEVPALNGFWEDGFQPSSHVHLGVAVSLRGGGLIAPAIHDTDTLSLDELMQSLRDLVERARAGRLRSSEMSDPTLTVTNLGEQGAEEVHGVIYPPQVALVGFGRISERPWASGGLLGVRPAVRATLAADHRASDGHEGSRLLAAIDRLLQAPEAL